MSEGWAPMGGSPGDGISTAGAPYQGSTVQPPPQAMAATAPIGYTQQPQQQSNYYNATTPVSGGVTRFASPNEIGSYQPTMMGAASPAPYYGGGPAATMAQQAVASAPGSYAARSSQAYATTNYNPQPTTATGPHASPASYSAGPTAATAPGSYAARSAQAYGTNAASQPTPNSMYGGVPQQQPQSGMAGISSSYAARPAPAYGAPQVQQQQPMYGGQYPQQQPQAGVNSDASYAARSAQAYGSAPMPPAQQPHQPVGSSSYMASPGGMAASSVVPQQQQQQQPSSVVTSPRPASTVPSAPQPPKSQPPQQPSWTETPEAAAMQQRYLTEATRKVQEHAYYMRQAMEQRNFPVLLDRAAHMVGELGGPPPHGAAAQAAAAAAVVATPHGPYVPSTPAASPGLTNTGLSAKLTPKNYYELYMRALEEMPNLEDYLYNLVTNPPPDLGASSSTAVYDAAGHQSVQRVAFTMMELYECVQYCPRVVSRLYLQICAGSALYRTGEVGAKWLLQDLVQAVRCEQNPIRGLFLRHFLLTMLRDKLPDTPEPVAPVATTLDATNATVNPPDEKEGMAGMDSRNASGGMVTQIDDGLIPAASGAQVTPSLVDILDKGSVKDSYEFVLTNFMEMNKLWVRIQHLPGEGNNKDVRKRRERERNDLRILVGTNLVRLSQLESITSKIYGEGILPQILEHIVTCGDPLSQAYLMDCLVQVFPDEYHIETLPILLNACPRLRDKVNIRTILQGLMDRLANYLTDDELLDESDTNQVKLTLARDSFGMFEECVQNVYNARGPKLTSKEVIRLQTALAQFSVKCYPGNKEQLSRCLGVCVSAMRQANASYDIPDGTVVDLSQEHRIVQSLDDVAVGDLEKLLSIPLDSLALQVLQLDNYGDLIAFLPWSNRRKVALNMLEAVHKMGVVPGQSVHEIDELFQVLAPVLQDESSIQNNAWNTGLPPVAAQPNPNQMARTTNLMAGLGIHDSQPFHVAPAVPMMDPVRWQELQHETASISKLIHALHHDDTDVHFAMLDTARRRIVGGTTMPARTTPTLTACIFAAVSLACRIYQEQAALPSAAVLSSSSTSTSSSPLESQTPSAVADETTGSLESRSGNKDETEAAKSDSGEAAQTGNRGDSQLSNGDEINHVHKGEEPTIGEPDSVQTKVTSESKKKTISCRKVFVFIQESIEIITKGNPELGIKLYLELCMSADSFSTKPSLPSIDASDFGPIAYEFLTLAFSRYEESITESKSQQRCIETMIGTLLAMRSLSTEEYENLITKTTQFAAKVLKKPDQCQLVALCAYLFYPAGTGAQREYSNPQRALECLQRSLKLADACTSAHPSNVRLFVELLDHYVFFFEKKSPAVTHAYITGLVALIQEHIQSVNASLGSNDSAVAEAKNHFAEMVRYIKRKKNDAESAELFGPVQVETVAS